MVDDSIHKRISDLIDFTHYLMGFDLKKKSRCFDKIIASALESVLIEIKLLINHINFKYVDNKELSDADKLEITKMLFGLADDINEIIRYCSGLCLL